MARALTTPLAGLQTGLLPVLLIGAALASAALEQQDDPRQQPWPEYLSPNPPAEFSDVLGDRPRPAPERVELGKKLFFDPGLSSDGTVSCAHCHQPAHGFADPRPLSIGVEGALTELHSPTLLNRGAASMQTWTGKVETLEAQAELPLENPSEMKLGVDGAVAYLKRKPEYVREFKRVFGAEPDRTNLLAALGAFGASLWLGDSPVDRFRAGDVSALDGPERSGLWFFESRGQCWRCHKGPNFSDEGFHNTGVGAQDGQPAAGREQVTKVDTDRGAFKTPTLRGLEFTAPYMHDGSLATLEDVVEFYRKGGGPNGNLSPHIVPIEMSDQDAVNLAAFLRALSRTNKVEDPPGNGR